MDNESHEKKEFNWKLILIFGTIFLLLFITRFNFIPIKILVILMPIIIVLLILLHARIIRYRSLSVAMDDRTKKILLSLVGFSTFIMGVGMVKNLQTLSWIIKLLPSNLDLLKYIYENFIRGIIYILFGLFFIIVPWLKMWGSRKKVAAFMLSFLFFFCGVDYTFMHWDSSIGLRNLIDSMSGLLYIIMGSLFALIFLKNPKSIENFS